MNAPIARRRGLLLAGAASWRLAAAGLLGVIAAAPGAAQITRYPSTSSSYAGQTFVQADDAASSRGSDTTTLVTPPSTVTATPSSADQLTQDDGGNTATLNTSDRRRGAQGANGGNVALDDRQRPLAARVPPPPPGEFERYVERVLGRRLQRFGASLLVPEARDFAPSLTTTVPADYRIGPGDEISIGLTGSVESQLRLTVDNEGTIFVPRVGRVNVAGVRYGDLRALLVTRVGEQYRDFRLTTSVTRLHTIRVYVTGFAQTPGAYTVSSLSTLANVILSAGGPSSAGSFRSVELRRGGRTISKFDFYDLLLRGDKSRDLALQDEDVLFVAPVGPQVALTGSVNAEAIYETRPGETVADLVNDAAGLATLADPGRTIVSRLSELDRRGWVEIDLAQAQSTPAAGGDVFRFLSVADYARPIERFNVLVTIEGEVARPGHYYLPPDATLADALRLAGGTTERAFLFGTEFDRVRVQMEQQRGFEEAIRQLELSLAAAPLSSAAATTADAVLRDSQLAAARAVVERLRANRPDGRVVLDVSPTSVALPLSTLLENNDRLYIPPRPTTVGVFGAVFRAGSFQIREGNRVSDYLKLAGGPQWLADKSQIFVVRANGAVLSKKNGGINQAALPGDVVFVPVKTHANSVWARVRDIATLLLSFGLTAAAIAAIN